MKYKSVDLFAGVGGIRLGFDNSSFETVYSNDFDKNCAITYNLNFNTAKMVVDDINKVELKTLPDFNLLTSGFPCQSFSIAGNRLGFKDKNRGNLFFRIIEILEYKKPEYVFLENVKNLKNHDDGKTMQVILSELKNLKYNIKFEVLNSAIHANIPQNRERIFIIAFLDKSKCDKFRFPEIIKLKKSFTDFLEENVHEKYFYTKKSKIYDKLKKEVIAYDTVYQWRRKYVRENKKNLVPTLTANMGSGGHNVPIIKTKDGIRKLTPRECFLLQGFPKKYKLPNISDSILYHQAGNSVTTTVIKKIAERLEDVI